MAIIRYYFLLNTETGAREESGPTESYLGEIGDRFGKYLVIDYAEEVVDFEIPEF